MFEQFIDKAFKPIVLFSSLIFLGQVLVGSVNHLIYLIIGASQAQVISYILKSAFHLWIVSFSLFLLGLWIVSFVRKKNKS